MTAKHTNDDSSCLPSRAEFHELRASASTDERITIPVWRELFADLETPVSAYLKLSDGAGSSVLLESVEGSEGAARHSCIAVDPRMLATWKIGEPGTYLDDAGTSHNLDEADPLDFIESRCNRRVVAPPRCELPRFIGGVVGSIGYACAGLWEHLPQPARSSLDMPDAELMVVDTLVVFDHHRHRVLAMSSVHLDGAATDFSADEMYDDAVRCIDDLVERLDRPVPAQAADATGIPMTGGVIAPSSCNTTPAGFRSSVCAAKEHIFAGDIIQVVLSQRWSRPTTATSLDVYRALRSVNPSPYMFHMAFPDHEITGASPELMVQVSRDGRVATHPIAGTRPRGATRTEDEVLEHQLRDDPKEQAEHVMLVDLGRNDIGRVAVAGSVDVSRYMDVERFSHVMHLTSHVSGDLRPDRTTADAIRACFPAGTVSGAPKIRAMQIIAELEPDTRGSYAGAVGMIGWDGAADLAITIRALVMKDGVAHVQAGAGIVADSDPDREYEETRSKARAMLRAIDVAERVSRSRSGIAAMPQVDSILDGS